MSTYQRPYQGALIYCAQHESEQCPNTCAKHGRPCGIPAVGLTAEDILTDDHICDARYFDVDQHIQNTQQDVQC